MISIEISFIVLTYDIFTHDCMMILSTKKKQKTIKRFPVTSSEKCNVPDRFRLLI